MFMFVNIKLVCRMNFKIKEDVMDDMQKSLLSNVIVEDENNVLNYLVIIFGNVGIILGKY